MPGGIILLFSGVLIALYPPLLTLIVAALLVVSGTLTIIVSYQNKRLRCEYGNRIVSVFFRM